MIEQDSWQIKQYICLQTCKYILHSVVSRAPINADVVIIQVVEIKDQVLSYK